MVALIGYLLSALVITGDAWAHPGTRLIGTGNDPYVFVFVLRWLPWALGHGLNPAFTDYLRFPHGVNLMWNSWVPLPGLILAPVTLLFGPVVSYNVLMVGSFALSGWAAFWAALRFVRNAWWAALAGLLYELSPYMAGHGLGNPNLVLVVFPPIVLILLDDLFRTRRRSARRIGMLLGLAIAAQVLISPEVLATTALASAVAVVSLILVNRSVGEWRRYARAVGFVLMTAVPLTALPLGFQLLGPDQIHGRLFRVPSYVADPAGFLVPSGQLLAAPHHLAAFAAELSGNHYENGMYVLPLLAAASALWALHRRDRTVFVLGATALTMSLLALGPRLHWEGRVTNVPLPEWLLGHVPVLENLLPVRLMLYAYLALILMAAILVEKLSGEASFRAAAAVAVGLVALMVPTRLPWESAAVPKFFTSSQVSILTRGEVTVLAPVARDGADAKTMLWQAVSGFRFRTTTGYLYAPVSGPPNGVGSLGPVLDPLIPQSDPLLHALIRAEDTGVSTLASTDLAETRADLARIGVGAVIVGPMEHQAAAVAVVDEVAGHGPVEEGDVFVWLLRKR
jgi:hypothetical protein